MITRKFHNETTEGCELINESRTQDSSEPISDAILDDQLAQNFKVLWKPQPDLLHVLL